MAAQARIASLRPTSRSPPASPSGAGAATLCAGSIATSAAWQDALVPGFLQVLLRAGAQRGDRQVLAAGGGDDEEGGTGAGRMETAEPLDHRRIAGAADDDYDIIGTPPLHDRARLGPAHVHVLAGNRRECGADPSPGSIGRSR